MVLGAALFVGCSTWRYRSVEPAQVIEDERPAVIRLMLTDSSEYEVISPSVERDSMMGFTAYGALTVPLDSVLGVAVRERDGLRSVLLTIGVILGLSCAVTNCVSH